MYRVIYLTNLGGIESQACRRFSNAYKAKSFGFSHDLALLNVARYILAFLISSKVMPRPLYKI
jgi:hypothetical protein